MDTSEYGIGAAMIQSGHPIAFGASKTLTDVETHYANIEQECLPVCFNLKMFHTCIYGRHVTVQNDHKLLEMIQQKPIHAVPHSSSACFCICRSMTTPSSISQIKTWWLANCLCCFPLHINSLPFPITQNVQHVQLSNAELDIIQGSIERDLVIALPIA